MREMLVNISQALSGPCHRRGGRGNATRRMVCKMVSERGAETWVLKVYEHSTPSNDIKVPKWRCVVKHRHSWYVWYMLLICDEQAGGQRALEREFDNHHSES
jgi:hypothetical protein